MCKKERKINLNFYNANQKENILNLTLLASWGIREDALYISCLNNNNSYNNNNTNNNNNNNK